MWTDEELRELETCAARLLAQVRESDGFEQVSAQVAEAQAVDAGLVAVMTAGLVKSFGMYREPRYLRQEAYVWEALDGVRRARVRPLSGLLLYWAGGDVSPYVPQEVWGQGLVEHHYEETATENALDSSATNFDTCGGFGLGSVGDALLELAEDRGLRALEVFAPLEKLLVVRSLQCAREAVRKAVESEAFRALPREASFQVLAMPGHDAPACLLWRTP
ncbi:hypothetical protein OWM54_20080 [Myxococcus sp. MISCRS1]|uniref:hypothetical protein n=1 Tax=Myxococcus TaxID=32 RepID=UPI00227173E0|nr:hypothetical protein [Myxococcus sp. MISCRS1]MCY0999439.1 hypothetical protein [Myxococcus sp. MISCRS1]